MNKIGKAMLCTVLTGAMAVGAAGAADLGSLSPQGAKAYLNQITTLQNKYGKAAARTDDGFKGLLTGLSMAKLVDMDGDFEGETEGVVDGVFMESSLRSAPGFTARIDGITELNN